MTPLEYQTLTRPHRRLLQQLAVDLEFFIEDVGPVAIFAREARIKSHESAMAKAQRLECPVHDLYDLAGMRIVVGTEPEVAVAKRFFQLKEAVKDLAIERDWVVERETGYRAQHLILSFGGHYSRSVYSTKVEIQLPTMLEHAFNFLSHTWAYKSEHPPDFEWHARFRTVSARLKQIDGEVAALHGGVVLATPSASPTRLTPFDYRRIAREKFGEDVPLPDAVDSVRQLHDLGVSTNEQLSAFFGNVAVRAAWEEFKSLAQRGSSLAEVMTGSKVNFWHIFGLRMSFTEKWLEKARKEASPSAEGPG